MKLCILEDTALSVTSIVLRDPPSRRRNKLAIFSVNSLIFPVISEPFILNPFGRFGFNEYSVVFVNITKEYINEITLAVVCHKYRYQAFKYTPCLCNL